MKFIKIGDYIINLDKVFSCVKNDRINTYDPAEYRLVFRGSSVNEVIPFFNRKDRDLAFDQVDLECETKMLTQ